MIYEGDFELMPAELAWIFEEKQWMWANNGVYGVPTAEDITYQLGAMIKDLEDRPHADFVRSGRLIVFRDPMMPGNYEIALDVGYVDADPSADHEEAAT